MKLVKTKPGDLRPRGRWANIVAEFMDSGLEAAEITELDEGYRKAYLGIYSYLAKYEHPVRVISRGKHVYLTRTDQ